MSRSRFYKAQCQGADFSDAQCQGADFSDAQCQGAYFNNTQCQGAYTGDDYILLVNRAKNQAIVKDRKYRSC